MTAVRFNHVHVVALAPAKLNKSLHGHLSRKDLPAKSVEDPKRM